MAVDNSTNTNRPAAAGSRRKQGEKAGEAHVANALRAAYEEAVKEDVPDEFLDLLGKLR